MLEKISYSNDIKLQDTLEYRTCPTYKNTKQVCFSDPSVRITRHILDRFQDCGTRLISTLNLKKIYCNFLKNFKHS
jgi:hypothetical protein